MIKLFCLILACSQVFSLTSVPALGKADPDSTNWSDVNLTITELDFLGDDLEKLLNNHVIYNSTHSEIIYKRGLQWHRVQNLYFTPVGHHLTSITVLIDFVHYAYAVELQDNYSKKVYEQIMTFQFVTSDSLDPADCRIDDVTTTPDPISPPIIQWNLKFVNTTEVTFDLLAVLWNSTLIDGARAVGTNYITDAANKKIGQGSYASIDGPSEEVDVDNSDLTFHWNGYIWKDDAKTYFRNYGLDFQLNVENGTTTILSSNIDDDWTPIC